MSSINMTGLTPLYGQGIDILLIDGEEIGDGSILTHLLKKDDVTVKRVVRASRANRTFSVLCGRCGNLQGLEDKEGVVHRKSDHLIYSLQDNDSGGGYVYYLFDGEDSSSFVNNPTNPLLIKGGPEYNLAKMLEHQGRSFKPTKDISKSVFVFSDRFIYEDKKGENGLFRIEEKNDEFMVIYVGKFNLDGVTPYKIKR